MDGIYEGDSQITAIAKKCIRGYEIAIGIFPLPTLGVTGGDSGAGTMTSGGRTTDDRSVGNGHRTHGDGPRRAIGWDPVHGGGPQQDGA